jgi:hypothetical protein
MNTKLMAALAAAAIGIAAASHARAAAPLLSKQTCEGILAETTDEHGNPRYRLDIAHEDDSDIKCRAAAMDVSRHMLLDICTVGKVCIISGILGDFSHRDFHWKKGTMKISAPPSALYGTTVDEFLHEPDRHAHPRSIEQYRQMDTHDLAGFCRDAGHLQQCLQKFDAVLTSLASDPSVKGEQVNTK